MTESNPGPPTISIQLSIQPSLFHATDSPKIIITATSQAEVPITIFTWPTIFNLGLSQKRSNFTCLDLTTNITIHLELTKGPKRPGFSRELGGRDDGYFVTLEPKTPKTFSAPFVLANRTGGDLVPGHRYRFAVNEGEIVRWWRFGRKEEVMVSPEEAASLGEPSGPPIHLEAVAVEFEVLE